MTCGKLTTLLACAGSALAVAVGAQAAPVIGVSDDATKYAPDGGASLFSRMSGYGLASNRIAVFWDPSRPGISEQPFLDRAIPAASAAGVQVVMAVYPLRSRTVGTPASFCGYLALLARTYPQVRKFVVGNEPNQPRFWQPQFDRAGKPLAAARYEATLAACYDALKAVDPAIDVIGVGLSNRGNDNPHAKSNVSTSPIRFVHDLGAAYRASGRTAPIMDELAFHCYPNVNTDPFDRHYRWPNAGCADLGRLKQAVWDAFGGTGQPTFAEAGEPAADRPLTLVLDEVGWQVRTTGRRYVGRENVPVVDETTQARTYTDVVRLAECDPSISTLHFFHLLDEPNRSGFQSGLLRVDGTPRPSAAAVQASATGGCTSGTIAWRHSTAVAGAASVFARGRWTVKATEDAIWSARVLRVGRTLTSRRAVGAASGLVRANRRARVVLRRALPPGRYVRVVRIRALLNPSRTTLLVGKPFTVAAGG